MFHLSRLISIGAWEEAEPRARCLPSGARSDRRGAAAPAAPRARLCRGAATATSSAAKFGNRRSYCSLPGGSECSLLPPPWDASTDTVCESISGTRAVFLSLVFLSMGCFIAPDRIWMSTENWLLPEPEKGPENVMFPVLLWLALSRFLKNLLIFLGLILYFPPRKAECSTWHGRCWCAPSFTQTSLALLSDLQNVLQKKESVSLTDWFNLEYFSH